MRIIAFTYEADVHCQSCAAIRFPSWAFPGAVDREGNPVHPVFSTDENDFTHCGTCGEGLQ